MPEPNVYQTPADYMAKLSDLSPDFMEANKLLARRYATAWDRISDDWTKLSDQVRIASQAGQPVKPGALYRMDRYQQLMQGIEVELQKLTNAGVMLINDNWRMGISKAVNDLIAQGVPTTVPGGVPDWDVRLDRTRAVAITAVTAKGAPVYQLLDRWGTEARRQASNALVSGVMAGKSTTVIGRELKEALGTHLWHANLIAQTEAMRAYRESQRVFIQENNDVFRGYVWRAACDAKTCAICWERHGTFYPATEKADGTVSVPPMESHPGCRCALVPRPRSIGDIVGDKTLPDLRPKDIGRERFAALPVAQQKRVLGPARYELYSTGKARLRDLFEMRKSGRWGNTPRMLNLTELNVKLGAPPKAPPTPKAAPAAPGALPPWKPLEPGAAWREARKLTEPHVDAKGADYIGSIHGSVEAKIAVQKKLTKRMLADREKLLDMYSDMDPAWLRQLGILEYGDEPLVGMSNTWPDTKAGKRRLLDAIITSGRPGYTFEDRVANSTRFLIDQWAGTSADDNQWSLLAQRAVQLEFDLRTASTKHMQRSYEWQNTVANAARAPELALMRYFVRQMYEQTQEELRRRGIKSVKLVRGVGTSVGDVPAGADWIRSEYPASGFVREIPVALKDLELQPASSFSISVNTAEGFGTNLIWIEVPAELLLSTPITGYGCLNEWEAVVLGGKGKAWIAWASQSRTTYT